MGRCPKKRREIFGQTELRWVVITSSTIFISLNIPTSLLSIRVSSDRSSLHYQHHKVLLENYLSEQDPTLRPNIVCCGATSICDSIFVCHVHYTTKAVATFCFSPGLALWITRSRYFYFSRGRLLLPRNPNHTYFSRGIQTIQSFLKLNHATSNISRVS